MGNACCGGEDVDVKAQKTIRGSAPPPKVMTPNEEDRREQARAAAEERARKNAVRGTQRYTYVACCLWRARTAAVVRAANSMCSDV